MHRYSPDETLDAVVIGTGAGGAPVLARLAAAGLKVVALEAGRWWSRDEYVQHDVSDSPLYWLDERLSGGEDPTAFGRNNSGCGVGGSSLHYGAYAPRPDPRDWKIRADFGVGRDWPFAHAELVPYLEEAERFLGVSGPSHYPWDPTRRYLLPPVPGNAPAELMRRGCEAVGIRTSAAPLLALSRPREAEQRGTCLGCGYCHQGCFNGAKASMDVTYLPVALRAGAEIRAECFVHAFDVGPDGAVRGVVYRQDGQDVVQRCRAVFLCAGGVETPRLLLMTGLANSSGQVGRNFMAHTATQVWGTFTDETHSSRGFPASLISEDMLRPPDADFAGGYLMQSLGIVPVTWATQVARQRGLWGQPLVDYLARFNHVAGIGINGECLPQEGNRLELSDERDGRGFRKPLIHLSLSDNEKRLCDHAERTMRGIWEAAGATDIWRFDRTAHTIGTCRMGTDPADAVVDPDGRSFDVPNLWISDNSTFPSALAANPTLTIVALAMRTADRFLSRHPGG